MFLSRTAFDQGGTPNRRVAAAIPGARFAEIANAAHFGNVEQPELVSELILDHLGAAPIPTEAKEVPS